MAVRRFSNSSRKVIKFPNIICVILVISHWRCLLITSSHDLAPSATLDVLTFSLSLKRRLTSLFPQSYYPTHITVSSGMIEKGVPVVY